MSLLTLPFTCACTLTTGSFQIPPFALPLDLTLCHCTTCRHQSGLLFIANAELPHGTPFTVSGPVKRYKASEGLSRYFCCNCGANVYLEDNDEKKELCAGLLQEGDGITKLYHHIFVGDTGDGGASEWFPGVEAWEGFSKVSKRVDMAGRKEQGKKESEKPRGQELHAYCHCKGVELKISGPDASSASLTAPRGDIVSQDTSRTSPAWWLRANGTKYLGGTCACDSCRLASGFDVQTWAFVPESNITQLDGKPLDYAAGTLKRYESSEGVYREFCSRCGATVFWHADRRPGIVDVSVGLLDADEGARAEEWLEWETDRVSFREEAQNKDLIERLGAGLKRWGERTGSSSVGK